MRYLTDADRRQGFDALSEAGLGTGEPLVKLEQGEELEPMPPEEEVRRFWAPIAGFTGLGVALVVYACSRG